MHIQQFHHFALVVPALDPAVAWYRDLLGFRPERRFGFTDAGVEIAHLVNDAGVRLELIQQAGAVAGPDAGRDVFAALETQGAKHVGFLVPDVDAAARELRDRGVEIVADVTAVPPAGVRNFWVRDVAGNLIEFNQWLDEPA